MRALVTGAGVRLGKAIADELTKQGYEVITHANRSHGMIIADLSTSAGVQTLANAVKGPLHLLVNNAAIYERTPFKDAPRAQLERILAVNLLAPFELTQALLPMLADGAAVINITDAALDKPYGKDQNIAAYLAAKAALASLTKSWALELGPKIRVNAVAPGPVAIALDATAQERQDLIDSLPLRREGSPEDVAKAVAYLARAEYVTGQTLRIDGGMTVC